MSKRTLGELEAGKITVDTINMTNAQDRAMVVRQLPPRKPIDAYPQEISFREAMTTRARLDEQAWKELLAAIDPRIRAETERTAKDLAEVERRLAKAEAELVEQDARTPTKVADMQKWAARRGEIAGMIAGYRPMVDAARRAYEAMGAIALEAARKVARERWKAAEATHEAAMVEYRRRADEVKAWRNAQREQYEAHARLYNRVAEAGVDLFRGQP